MRAARRIRGRAAVRPSTRAMRVDARSRRGAAASAVAVVNATIVLSMPTSHAPPSRISVHAHRRDRRRRAARSSARCGRSGSPTARRCRAAEFAASSARATGCDGTRRPTLSWPPVTTSRHVGCARHDQRQRARPERVGQRARAARHCARPSRRSRRCRPRGRSPDGRPAGPWPRRCGARRPRCAASAPRP